MTSSVSIVRSLLLLLLVSALVLVVEGQPIFNLATDNAGWFSRQGSYTTVVNTGTLENPTWLPIVIGGQNIFDGFYFNDVWVATGPSGAWSQTTAAAPFSPREYGGLINVPVGIGSSTSQILVLIAGQDLDEVLLNDIWASADLGATWSPIIVPIAFSPRKSFGLVIGTPYDFASTNNPLPFSTEYAFLFGGLTNNGSANDVYYTAGMGDQPWLSYPGGSVAPWSPRSRFGFTSYAGGSRVAIAGGLTQNGTYLDEVWVWDFRTWTQVYQSSSFPPSYALNFVVTQTPSISQQTFYILAGATQINPDGNEENPVNFLQVVYRSQNLSNWTALSGPAATPLRAFSGGVISPINNLGFLYLGEAFGTSQQEDVWSGQL